MASGLPDSLQLREIKYGDKSTPKARVAAGEQLLAAGRTAEALDLFLIAGDDTAVRKIFLQALAEGRPALLMDIERRGKPVSREDWKVAGESAMKAERWREAYRCFLHAKDEEALARVQEEIPDYELFLPQGK